MRAIKTSCKINNVALATKHIQLKRLRVSLDIEFCSSISRYVSRQKNSENRDAQLGVAVAEVIGIRVRRDVNPSPEILKLHNHGNFAARDVILNGDYSNVRVCARGFAGVRRDSLHANALQYSVYIAGVGMFGGELCVSLLDYLSN